MYGPGLEVYGLGVNYTVLDVNYTVFYETYTDFFVAVHVTLIMVYIPDPPGTSYPIFTPSLSLP